MSWAGWMGVLYLKQQFKHQTLVCLSAWLPSSWNAKWCLPSILTQIELDWCLVASLFRLRSSVTSDALEMSPGFLLLWGSRTLEPHRKTSRLQGLMSGREAAGTEIVRPGGWGPDAAGVRFTEANRPPPQESQQNSWVIELQWKGLSLPLCFPKTWERHRFISSVCGVFLFQHACTFWSWVIPHHSWHQAQ